MPVNKINMIVASDTEGGIGIDNNLPWYCPEDLKYFKEVTSEADVVMGSKTFDSLPFKGGLPDRYNYVITSDQDVDGENYQMTDLESVIGCLFSRNYTEDSVWIIGGKSVYEQLFHLVEEIHHTVIKGDYKCDTFIDTGMWEDDIDWCLEGVKTLSEVAEVKIWRKC